MPIEIVRRTPGDMRSNIEYLSRNTESDRSLIFFESLDFGNKSPDYIVISTSSIRKLEGIKRSLNGEMSSVNGSEKTIPEFQQHINQTIFNGNGALPEEEGLILLGTVKGVKVYGIASGGETDKSAPLTAAMEKLNYRIGDIEKIVNKLGSNGLVVAMDCEANDGQGTHPKFNQELVNQFNSEPELKGHLVAYLNDAINITKPYTSVTGIGIYDVETGRFLYDEVHYPIPMNQTLFESEILLDPYASLATVGQQLADWEELYPDPEIRWMHFIGTVGVPIEIFTNAARLSRQRQDINNN